MRSWPDLERLGSLRGGTRYVDEVLDQVRERLAPGELEDPRPNSGDWWGSRSDGSAALDWLFRSARSGFGVAYGFVKEFDLLERIVPSEVQARPRRPRRRLTVSS